MNLALRIQEAYKHDMAYAEPTNFESNFAKKNGWTVKRSIKCIILLKGFGVFCFNFIGNFL